MNLYLTTVWKFQDFSVFLILREINFIYCRSSKNAVFAIFGALHCVNFTASKCVKVADFATLESTKMNFTLNQSGRKMTKFPHCSNPKMTDV